MKNRYTLYAIAVLSLFTTSVRAQNTFYPESYKWYRLVSYSSSTSGEDKCVMLTPRDAEGHPGELWAADLLDSSSDLLDYQYFTFEQNPENSEEFAMICVGAPGGYVDPTPTEYGEEGRWKYVFAEDITDDSPSKYGFVFKSSKARNASGGSDGAPYYAIATTEVSDDDWLMNYGGSTEDYAIDLSQGLDPSDPDNSLFKFVEKKNIITQEIPIQEAGQSPASIYNLQGIKIANPSKGLYIINGKLAIR